MHFRLYIHGITQQSVERTARLLWESHDDSSWKGNGDLRPQNLACDELDNVDVAALALFMNDHLEVQRLATMRELKRSFKSSKGIIGTESTIV